MTGASVACGIHFSSAMVLVTRSNAAESTSWSGASRATDPKEKQPESPQVMFVGFGRGFAATASACLANKAEAVTTEAKMKSRMVVQLSGCYFESRVGVTAAGRVGCYVVINGQHP